MSFVTDSASLQPADVLALADRWLAGQAPLRAALDAAVGAELRAATSLSEAAASALSAHARRLDAAVGSELASLSTLSAAVTAAAAELTAQDRAMLRVAYPPQVAQVTHGGHVGG